MTGRENTNEKRGRIKDREAVQGAGRNNFLSPDNPQHETTPGLHGLHAQSSTETSGLGETMTSGFSSQESVNSAQGSTTQTTTTTTKTRDLGGYSLTPEEARATRERINTRPRDRVNGTASGMKSDQTKHGQSPTHHPNHLPHQHHHHNHHNNSAKHVGGVSDNYEQLFTRERRDSLSPCVGLHVENINDEWDKRSYEEWERHSSKGRRNSARSSQGGSIKSKTSRRGSTFFGMNAESAWMKWSRERRASYQRRMQAMEKEKDKERTSTPVKKARQEGLKFVHPDLEAKYLSEDDINELRRHQQEQFKTYKVIEKSKKKHKENPFKHDVKLTLNQWHVLNDFWDHDMFVHVRWMGLLVSLFSLVFLAVSTFNTFWLTYDTSTREYSLIVSLGSNPGRGL